MSDEEEAAELAEDAEAVTDDDSGEEDELNPRKRGLGRGLGALFEDDEKDPYSEEDDGGDNGNGGFQRRMIGIDQLAPGPYQPRRNMDADALEELAQSIAVHGVLQPLLVRSSIDGDGTYEIIAGERRWRAAQQAQLHQVPAIVLDIDESSAYEIALIENLQREDLNPLDEAAGFRRLMDEFDYTQEKLAAELGKSRSYIANILRLSNLPEGVQVYVRDGSLSAGHARALITAENPEELARRVVNEGLSVRETEKLAAGGGKKSGSSGKKSKPAKDVDTLALEEEISNVLGMAVTIDMKGEGRGILKVEYKSLDQLDEVLHRLSHYPGRQQSG